MKNLYATIFSFLLIGSISLSAQTTTFNYTGAVQTYTVPLCATTITVDVIGASGGANGPTNGGLGGRVQATIPVTPGEVLDIYVGQTGINSLNLPAGAYNGGGGVYSYSACGSAGTGGGASDIRRNPYSLSDRLVVAGGGGGAGGYVAGNQTYPGGNGGGLIALDGTPWPTWPNSGGKGGTQAAGGAAGIACCSCPTYTTAGALFQGGNGSGDCAGGAGGGGGYYGGGGSCFAGGGGGSSYTAPTVTSVTHTQGYQNGNGVVMITAVSGTPSSPSSITGSTNFCAGSTATFSISSVIGATSYTWTVPAGATINSGQGTTSINVTFGSSSGNISVTADNSCGSSAATNLAITINSAPTVGFTSSPATTVCSGTSVTLSGTGATTYVWSGGITNAVPFSAVATTTYTVTGSDAIGCANTATVTITVNPLPTVGSTISPSSAVCSGTSVTLSGTGATTYVWSGGVSDGVPFSAMTTTTYTVTGTDANGCSNTATATVTVNPLPNVTATAGSSSICIGSSTTVSANGASTYLWDFGGTLQTENVTPASSTTYTVTGTDVNGCVNTATVSVTVNPLPTVSLGPDISQCLGNVMLDAQNPGSTYLWSSGATTQTIIVSVSGTYFVTVTNANGCSSSDTINVNFNAGPIVDLGNDITQCGGTVTLDAGNPGSTYLWNTNATTQTITVNTSGSYSVTVTNSSGCTGTDFVNVTINPLPTVNGSATTTTVCLNDAAVALTGTPVGGTWSGTGVTGSSFNPTTAGVGSHTATYTYTDSLGCTNTASVVFTVNSCASVAEANLASGVSVFPNPNNGIFTISVNASIGEMQIEISDMEGRLVYSSLEKNVQAGFTKQISLEQMASGMYTLKLTTSTDQRMEKISVEK
jgi:hypothetical protein